ncbi:DinB family protein [Cytophaga sp. FL35]|uniref:DinB family protein n=1 Tax=Cytophaga sp. FL35 TaxID=1904456 RepID=UPI001653A2BC|nr:DinB family protein [Cytophaga sp. FL35]MBC6999768.1 DinB family protein [Cytophaga sp. FL35]
MKYLTCTLVVILTTLQYHTVQGQQNDFIDDFLVRLENSKKYMVLVAEMMPEDSYHYRPTPESLSFAENLLHVGFAMDFHCQTLLGERAPKDWQTDTVYKTEGKSKKEMISLIEKTFDETIAFLKEFNPESFGDELDYFGLTRNKRQIILLLSDHITHHRGQMLVYLRLNNIVPPRYVLYQ